MSKVDEIRTFVQKRLVEIASASEQVIPDPTDDFDLIESGILDSLAFVSLISSIEETFGAEIDFGELEPDEFTTVGGLVRCVVRSLPAEPAVT